MRKVECLGKPEEFTFDKLKNVAIDSLIKAKKLVLEHRSIKDDIKTIFNTTERKIEDNLSSEMNIIEGAKTYAKENKWDSFRLAENEDFVQEIVDFRDRLEARSGRTNHEKSEMLEKFFQKQLSKWGNVGEGLIFKMKLNTRNESVIANAMLFAGGPSFLKLLKDYAMPTTKTMAL